MLKSQTIIYFLLISLFINNLYSQNDNTKLNDEIKYTFVKQDLKEFLTIQALLSENRMDELIEFLDENNYAFFEGERDRGLQYFKNRNNLNEVVPIVIIQSGKNEEGFIDNSLLIYFGFNDKNTVQWTYSSLDAQTISHLFRSSIDIGYMFPMFEGIITNETLDVETIDRYTKKLIPKKNPEFAKIVKASNFYSFEEWPNDIFFAGPGKTNFTVIKFNSHLKNDNGNMANIFIKSGKLEDPSSEKPFNLDFFFNLKNLNDRIWLDK